MKMTNVFEMSFKMSVTLRWSRSLTLTEQCCCSLARGWAILRQFRNRKDLDVGHLSVPVMFGENFRPGPIGKKREKAIRCGK